MNILITTYFFYPEITPRAFRAFELAKEFSLRGHKVVVMCPYKGYEYSGIQKEYGFEVKTFSQGVIFNRFSKQLVNSSAVPNEKSSFNNWLRSLFRYLFQIVFIGGKDFESALFLGCKLLFGKTKYDLHISVGLPFSIHFGSFFALFFSKDLAKVKVADYGDPFSMNPQLEILPHYKYVEKFVLSRFDYVVIPTRSAFHSFDFFKKKGRVLVIPQGYDLKCVVSDDYRATKVCRFAYAGLFYPKIRNPIIFFQTLVRLKIDFEFTIFTDVSNDRSLACIEPFAKILGEKLVVKDAIPRDKCIYELSKFDFLVNVDNISSFQKPSKLVDYYLAGRPVFSFSQENFSKEKLMRFMAGDWQYNALANFNIDAYDIRNIADKFISLSLT